MKNILLDILMWIITTLSNIFIRPIMVILTAFIPEVATYITEIQTFFQTYIFNTMKFCIKLLLNVTGLPQNILIFAFTYLALKITLHISMQAVKLSIKIWRLVKP